MILYEILGRFYDDVMGDQKEAATRVHELIQKFNPGATSILELACGTGSFLYNLSNHYKTTAGLDLSSIMLSIARTKVPDTPLYRCDMTDFHFYEKFDVVICMNDSINHMTVFGDWKKLFLNASRHLTENGILIFDVNTVYKLKKLSEAPPVIHEFGNNLLITNVYRKTGDLYVWHLRVFEDKGKNMFELHEELLEEKAFTRDRIKKALLKEFKNIRVYDLENGRVTTRSQRLHFVAIKR